MTWERMSRIANAWLPRPRILHPWPNERFAVKHPRYEPGVELGATGSIGRDAPTPKPAASMCHSGVQVLLKPLY